MDHPSGSGDFLPSLPLPTLLRPDDDDETVAGKQQRYAQITATQRRVEQTDDFFLPDLDTVASGDVHTLIVCCGPCEWGRGTALFREISGFIDRSALTIAGGAESGRWCPVMTGRADQFFSLLAVPGHNTEHRPTTVAEQMQVKRAPPVRPDHLAYLANRCNAGAVVFLGAIDSLGVAAAVQGLPVEVRLHLHSTLSAAPQRAASTSSSPPRSDLTPQLDGRSPADRPPKAGAGRARPRRSKGPGAEPARRPSPRKIEVRRDAEHHAAFVVGAEWRAILNAAYAVAPKVKPENVVVVPWCFPCGGPGPQVTLWRKLQRRTAAAPPPQEPPTPTAAGPQRRCTQFTVKQQSCRNDALPGETKCALHRWSQGSAYCPGIRNGAPCRHHVAEGEDGLDFTMCPFHLLEELRTVRRAGGDAPTPNTVADFPFSIGEHPALEAAREAAEEAAAEAVATPATNKLDLRLDKITVTAGGTTTTYPRTTFIVVACRCPSSKDVLTAVSAPAVHHRVADEGEGAQAVDEVELLPWGEATAMSDAQTAWQRCWSLPAECCGNPSHGTVAVAAPEPRGKGRKGRGKALQRQDSDDRTMIDILLERTPQIAAPPVIVRPARIRGPPFVILSPAVVATHQNGEAAAMLVRRVAEWGAKGVRTLLVVDGTTRDADSLTLALSALAPPRGHAAAFFIVARAGLIHAGQQQHADHAAATSCLSFLDSDDDTERAASPPPKKGKAKSHKQTKVQDKTDENPQELNAGEALALLGFLQWRYGANVRRCVYVALDASPACGVVRYAGVSAADSLVEAGTTLRRLRSSSRKKSRPPAGSDDDEPTFSFSFLRDLREVTVPRSEKLPPLRALVDSAVAACQFPPCSADPASPAALHHGVVVLSPFNAVPVGATGAAVQPTAAPWALSSTLVPGLTRSNAMAAVHLTERRRVVQFEHRVTAGNDLEASCTVARHDTFPDDPEAVLSARPTGAVTTFTCSCSRLDRCCRHVVALWLTLRSHLYPNAPALVVRVAANVALSAVDLTQKRPRDGSEAGGRSGSRDDDSDEEMDDDDQDDEARSQPSPQAARASPGPEEAPLAPPVLREPSAGSAEFCLMTPLGGAAPEDADADFALSFSDGSAPRDDPDDGLPFLPVTPRYMSRRSDVSPVGFPDGRGARGWDDLTAEDLPDIIDNLALSVQSDSASSAPPGLSSSVASPGQATQGVSGPFRDPLAATPAPMPLALSFTPQGSVSGSVVGRDAFPSGAASGYAAGYGFSLASRWEQLWPHLGGFVRPFEADRQAYRLRLGRSAQIEVHQVLFWALVDAHGSVRRVLEGFQLLGFYSMESEAQLVRDGPEGSPLSIRFRTHQSLQSRVLFEDEGSPIDRIRELEEEVRDLRNQLTRAQGGTVHSSASSFVGSQPGSHRGSGLPPPGPASPAPQPAVTSMRPGNAAVAGGSVIQLRLTSLDPDCAPYTIRVDRHILPCTVLDRRSLVFVAPPHAPGSVPVHVMCCPSNASSSSGRQRKYCTAVWLEFTTRSQPPRPRLTRHAINQLAPDIPLPSSTTAADPSETKSNTEGDALKSEYDETETVESESVAASDSHIPLTRETLNLLSMGPAVLDPKGSVTSVSNSEAPSQPTLPQTAGDLATASNLSPRDTDSSDPPMSA